VQNTVTVTTCLLLAGGVDDDAAVGAALRAADRAAGGATLLPAQMSGRRPVDPSRSNRTGTAVVSAFARETWTGAIRIFCKLKVEANKGPRKKSKLPLNVYSQRKVIYI
jgi:hypothetical protein